MVKSNMSVACLDCSVVELYCKDYLVLQVNKAGQVVFTGLKILYWYLKDFKKWYSQHSVENKPALACCVLGQGT